MAMGAHGQQGVFGIAAVVVVLSLGISVVEGGNKEEERLRQKEAIREMKLYTRPEDIEDPCFHGKKRQPLNGLVCNQIGWITEIKIENHEVSGRLPDNIDLLVELESITIRATHFGGPLPATIGKLTKLKTLVIPENSFSGHLPSELGSLHKLETLRLHDNGFNGHVPDSIWNLKLKVLDLGGNAFYGPLPETNNNRYQTFDISDALFDCPIPKWVKNHDGYNWRSACTEHAHAEGAPTWVIVLAVIGGIQFVGVVLGFVYWKKVAKAKYAKLEEEEMVPVFRDGVRVHVPRKALEEEQLRGINRVEENQPHRGAENGHGPHSVKHSGGNDDAEQKSIHMQEIESFAEDDDDVV